MRRRSNGLSSQVGRSLLLLPCSVVVAPIRRELLRTGVSCKTGHRIVRSPARNARRKAALDRCASQDSLDELSLDDYWKEVENIHQSSGSDAEQQDEVQLKVPDEGEQEEAWLAEAGLATLFDESVAVPEDTMSLLSTLTRTQAAAVQRRVETVKQTLRKKNKQHQVPDVRDIFKPPSSQGEKLKGEALPAKRSENGKGEVSSDGMRVSDAGARSNGGELCLFVVATRESCRATARHGTFRRPFVRSLPWLGTQQDEAFLRRERSVSSMPSELKTDNKRRHGQAGSVCENGEGIAARSETHVDLEASFSEQALVYKEGTKGGGAPSDADDKLP
ncbi:hypothetical protein Z043_122174, partial [Scleropages formosus]